MNKIKKPAFKKGYRSEPCSAIDCEGGYVVDDEGKVTTIRCSTCNGTGYEKVKPRK